MTNDTPINDLHTLDLDFEATEVRLVLDKTKSKAPHPMLRLDWTVEKVEQKVEDKVEQTVEQTVENTV